jgi:hypothetical protein
MAKALIVVKNPNRELWEMYDQRSDLFIYLFGQRLVVGETPKKFSVTKGQIVVKDQI